MKLVRNTKDGSRTKIKTTDKKTKIERPPWKVLIVDDEDNVHAMTRFALKHFEFADKPLQILHAMSGKEARDILAGESDIAVALIDVIMETDDAGLQLVDFIRNELQDSFIRLIIRTGQPGMAPEREVIERYDIDDYKSKTELRADKLYTTMRVALKSYRDLITLDSNRKALRKILEAVPEFHQAQSLNKFFNGVLTQIIGLCNLGENGLISTVNSGLVITANNNHVTVQSGTGRFAKLEENPDVEIITQICSNQVLGKKSNEPLPLGALLIPLSSVNKKPIGFVYLENAQHLSQADLDLIHIMAHQCATALENLQLYIDLKEANQKTLQMLEVAEQARQEAEQARREAEAANQAKTAFLANVSHELRTPLNGISGASQILRTDKDLTVKQSQSLNIIQSSSEYLSTVVNDILDISQMETNQLELHPYDFCLNKFIHHLVEVFKSRAAQKRLTFIYEPSPHLPTGIHADEKRLRQILINLLSNAVKFTQRGGVRFKVDSFPSTGESSIAIIRFQVEDTGLGIAQEHLEKIFLPFKQVSNWKNKSEGTGLGLAITKKLVEMMKGELHVESTLGKGSAFWVELEFRNALEWMTPRSTDNLTIVGYEGPRRKILVVDDREENRFVLVNILMPLGFEIYEAWDGREGLEKVHELKPDLIITDLVMPNMDGFELIRKVKQLPEFQQLPILAESASVLDDSQTGEGMNLYEDFFSKPVCPKTVLALLQKHLRLTWIYEQPKEVATEESPTLLADQELAEIEGLSYAQAAQLLELIRLCEFYNLQKYLDQLEQFQAELRPLVDKMRQLAENYDFDIIEEWVKTYLDTKASTSLVKLPADQAAIFFELGRIGDVMGILEQAEQLEQRDKQLQPLIDSIRQFAQSYRTDEICALVKPYLDSIEDD
ncbi:MAG TPA: DUF3369 domain-containing protein [Thioploca sp.]|nr:MAG: hypothetical protein DRR08_20140 [Gammaproteobacteria bacterium]HDN27329.1 DUF3369 domain-containing protein [Thioploca sp.]